MPRFLQLVPIWNKLPDAPRQSSVDATSDALARTTTTLWHSLSQFVAKLAFWTAISLPVLYLPLLLAGLDTTTDLLVFLGLFLMHVLTLLAGRTHRSSTPS